MLKIPPADRTDACGVSNAKSTERAGGDRRRRRAARNRSRLKSDPSNGNFSRAWFGDHNKHGYQKFNVKMRYYHLVSHVYSYIYDDRARDAARTIGADTTQT